MSLHDASNRSRMDGLVELRNQLATSIDNCESMRDKATLSARYLDVVNAIADLESMVKPEGVTAVDELRIRREQRSRERGLKSS